VIDFLFFIRLFFRHNLPFPFLDRAVRCELKGKKWITECTCDSCEIKFLHSEKS